MPPRRHACGKSATNNGAPNAESDWASSLSPREGAAIGQTVEAMIEQPGKQRNPSLVRLCLRWW